MYLIQDIILIIELRVLLQL